MIEVRSSSNSRMGAFFAHEFSSRYDGPNLRLKFLQCIFTDPARRMQHRLLSQLRGHKSTAWWRSARRRLPMLRSAQLTAFLDEIARVICVSFRSAGRSPRTIVIRSPAVAIPGDDMAMRGERRPPHDIPLRAPPKRGMTSRDAIQRGQTGCQHTWSHISQRVKIRHPGFHLRRGVTCAGSSTIEASMPRIVDAGSPQLQSQFVVAEPRCASLRRSYIEIPSMLLARWMPKRCCPATLAGFARDAYSLCHHLIKGCHCRVITDPFNIRNSLQNAFAWSPAPGDCCP